MRRLVRQAGRAALILLAPLLIGATGLTTNLDGRLLEAHNRERATMGLPPLRWDATLTDSARGWADHLAESGAFSHAPEAAADPQGENLWSGPADRFSAEAMVDGWIAEKRFYKPGRFPDNSVTGNVADVGHYTQVMWRHTGEVGCALAERANRAVLVCRYADAGNYMGERPF